MNLRAAIWSVALIAHAATPCYSQESTAPPVVAELSPSHVALGREALSALLVESGVFADITPIAFQQVMPYFRVQIQSTRFFELLPPERQRALLDYFDNEITAAGMEEVAIATPGVLNRFAPRMAALFSEADLTDIIAFARHPDGAGALHATMLARASGGFPPALTPGQIETLQAFGESATGRVWIQRASEFYDLSYDVGRAATSAPNVRARFMRDLCAITGPDCPPGWRTET